jgi:hypothetical protein
VALVGRSAELRELDRLVGRAAVGSGGPVTLVGPPGSGKTALVAAAADIARGRGFEVLGASPVRGQPGRLVWAQPLHDAGAPDERVPAIGQTGELAGQGAGRPRHPPGCDPDGRQPPGRDIAQDPPPGHPA